VFLGPNMDVRHALVVAPPPGAGDDRRRTTSSDPLKKAAIRSGPAGSNPPHSAAPNLSSDRSPGLRDSAVNILRRSRPPCRVPAQRLKIGLDPTVLSPAAKSILGGFSGGSGHEKARTFDKKRVSSKVAVPVPWRSAGLIPETSPIWRAKCQKYYVEGIRDAPKTALFLKWRLVTGLLGLGRSTEPLVSAMFYNIVQLRTDLVVTPDTFANARRRWAS
jgi:hypothetical protein